MGEQKILVDKKVQENGIYKLGSNFHGFTKNRPFLNDPIDLAISTMALELINLSPIGIKWKSLARNFEGTTETREESSF